MHGLEKNCGIYNIRSKNAKKKQKVGRECILLPTFKNIPRTITCEALNRLRADDVT